MHSTTTTTPPPPPRSTPTQTLHQITTLLNHLLTLSLSITTFTSRWLILRSKLILLNSSLTSLSDNPHWSDNSLLVTTLLPNLLTTLLRIQTLSNHCSDTSSPPPGKLLMQSDLDMATHWLSKQTQDLDLMLRSGVLRQSTAIVLSHPGPTSGKEELSLFIKDLFTRLQIGGFEFKKKAMESLIQLLLEDPKLFSSLVAKEGNVGYLGCLMDLNNDLFCSLREQAVAAVSILVSACDLSRKCVFEEGVLGPLLRIMHSGSMVLKEKAAMAVEYITSDPDNAWAISAYGGVSILIEICRSGSLVAQSHAVGSIRNVCIVEDIRIALAEEGAVPVLIQLLNSGMGTTQQKAANCIAILASCSEYFRGLILLEDKGLQRLLHLLIESSSSDTLEHVLHAIYSLSASESTYRVLSNSTVFITRIGEIIKQGNANLQHVCASLLASLSICDGNKRAIVGCMGSLVKLMETAKPDGVQEAAANALVSLLGVRSNRKYLVRDEKCVMRLVQMLDPMNELVSKKFPVAVVSAVMAGGSQGCRKRLMATGAYVHLQRLSEIEVVGAKKALQRLSGNRLKSIFSRAWRE